MLSLAREKGEVRVDQGSELGALREVLAMALPIIVAMASNTLMYFADSWMVSGSAQTRSLPLDRLARGCSC